MSTGYIYRITNTLTGDFYVGMTFRNPQQRQREHMTEARTGSDLHLHRAIRKYDEISFSLDVIEVVDYEMPNDVFEREQFWIEHLQPQYNMTSGGEGTFGYSHGEEARKKISAGNKGKTRTPEMRERYAEARRGKPRSEELKQKISAYRKGKPLPPETREKMRQSRLGKKHSPETRAKIAEANRRRAKK